MEGNKGQSTSRRISTDKMCVLLHKGRHNVLQKAFRSDALPLGMEVRIDTLPPVIDYKHLKPCKESNFM